MPAFIKLPPDSNVTLEATSSSRRYFETCRAHLIYFALGVVAILLLVRLVTAHLRDSKLAYPWTSTDHKQESEKTRETKGYSSLHSKGEDILTSWAPAGPGGPTPPNGPYFSPDQPGTELGSRSPLQSSDLTAGYSSPAVQAGLIGPSWRTPAMDGDASQRRKDHSKSATSRGVSTNSRSAADIRRQHDPSRDGKRLGSSAERTTSSRSSRSSTSQASSSRRQGGSANGADSSGSKGKGEGKGKEPMTNQGTWSQGAPSTAPEESADPSRLTDDFSWPGSTQGAGYANLDYTMPSWQFSHPPPPPPPLTPPTFSDSVFPFENRRLSYAVSIPPELDGGFVQGEENPDYGSSSTSADILSSSPRSAATPGIPRRRSYTRSVPIGIPTPTTSASSMSETITSPSAFSPSSFPPRAPILPPPPPGSGELPYDYQFVGGPGGPGILLSEEEVDLHGEIMSVMDESGHAWTRHTRVYGGGVCLACIGAGGEGGFYGDKVPLEDRR